MNDWLNDPIEEHPDLYGCPKCSEDMEYKGLDSHGLEIYVCVNCGNTTHVKPEILPPYDTLEEKEQAYGEPIQPALCPHGNVWGECSHCDFESDIAFDAERERKMK